MTDAEVNHWKSLTEAKAIAVRQRRGNRNPWGVSGRQSEALKRLAACGCRKVVAYEMEITEQRLCQLIQAACNRMNVRTDMQAVVLFDRWARAQA